MAETAHRWGLAPLVEAGRTESWSMPLEETIFLQEIMDGLRKDWGMSS